MGDEKPVKEDDVPKVDHNPRIGGFSGIAAVPVADNLRLEHLFRTVRAPTMGKKSIRGRVGDGVRPRQHGQRTTGEGTTVGNHNGGRSNGHRSVVEVRHQLRLERASPRAAATCWMEVYSERRSCSEAAFDDWHNECMCTFYSYFELCSKALSSKEFFNDDNHAFLHMVRRSRKDPLLCRVWALTLSGMFAFSCNSDAQADALGFFDKAVTLCNSATELEKERTIYLPESTHTVGSCLERARDNILTLLDKFRRRATLGWGPDGRDIAVPRIAGLTCDYCCRHRDNVGVEALQLRSRCEMAFYCSTECQRKAWNERQHKKVCRKQGQFKVGDMAETLQPFGNVMAGEQVRVIAPDTAGDANSANHEWLVASLNDDDDTEIVPVQQLKRVRPGLCTS